MRLSSDDGYRGDDGFTLVELLMVMAMTAIILTAVGSAVTVGLRTTDDTGIRLTETVDTQSLSAYLPQDVQSASATATGIVTNGTATAGCASLSGENVLALTWTDADTGTAYGSTYRTLTEGVENKLVRFTCINGATTSLTIARSLVAQPAGAGVAVAGDQVTFTIVASSGYTGSVSAVRRTPNAVAVPPPAPACSVQSATISPASGGVLPSGTLVVAPTVTVTTSGPCGTMSAVYRPKPLEALERSEPLGASGTRTLEKDGWASGSRSIDIFSGSSKVSSLPFAVTDIAPCAVTSVRTQPTSGSRRSNPSPNTLTTADAVVVSADFSASCGADLTLAYDPGSTTTAPTAQTLAFVGTGTSRSVDIPATTKWIDGAHELVVREGTEERARGSFTVTPAACNAASIVLSEVSVNNNGAGNKLNKDVRVTMTTTGVCDVLKVKFTPGAAAQQVQLVANDTFDSWTVLIDKNTYAWADGQKTFEAVREDGSSFTPARTTTLRVD